MALPKNRKAAQAVLAELELEILGQKVDSKACNCGAVQCNSGVASVIHPGGNSYPGMECLWDTWSVEVDVVDGVNWNCQLSEFLSCDEIAKIFEEYFDCLEYVPDSAYELEVRGAERVYAGLPAAVRIEKIKQQVRFSFDWGKEQIMAHCMNAVCAKKYYKGDEKFNEIISSLWLIHPEVYLGGPKPELKFESSWLNSYMKAMQEISENGKEIFFQNISSHSDFRGTVEGGMTVAVVL